MQDYKPSIIADVQRSIGAVNDIVVSLQRDDSPLSSDLLAMSYSQATVEDFHNNSQIVTNYLRSASQTASNWLKETGDSVSRNLDDARRIEESIRETSSGLREADAHTRATEDRIRVLESDIHDGGNNLSSAQRSLQNARDELDRQETVRNVMRVGAIAAFFFAPVISFALTVIDIAALQHAVDEQEDTISTIENQLSASRSQLQFQRDALANERAESSRLSSKISQLKQQQETLNTKVHRLESARATLAELSTRINDCLHTVNGALSSSTTIATMGSMRNVISGIRGVVQALGADSMFSGPLAQLNEAALDALDRRVAGIKRLQLAV